MRLLPLLICLWLGLGSLANAGQTVLTPDTLAKHKPLIVAYGGYVVEPYIFLKDNRVVGGVYWELGKLISEQLQRPVSFQRVPRRRLELFLADGQAHVMLFAHPSWLIQPEALHWTSPLMTEYDLLVQLKTHTFPVHSLDDLSGKRIGTILGYHYPGLADEPHRSQILRDDAKDLSANFKRLAQGRVDALLDSNVLIDYFLQQHQMRDRFHLVDTWGIRYEIASGVSPKSPVSAEQLSKVYQQLHELGKIDALIEKYAPNRAELVHLSNSH